MINKRLRKLFAPLTICFLALGGAVSAGNLNHAVAAEAAGDFTATISKYNSTQYSTGVPDGLLVFGTASNNLKNVNTGGASFTVTYAKNSSTTTSIFNNTAGEVRLYGDGSGTGNGAQLTFAVTGTYVMKSVAVTTTTNSGYTINGGTTITALVAETPLSDLTSFVLKDVALTTAQIRITSVAIGYSSTVSKTLSSIAVTTEPTDKNYFDGETFDPSGMVVTATYSDLTTENVTSSCSFAPSPLTTGTTSVTVTYASKTATITGLTVLAVVLENISIKTPATQTVFALGQTFVSTGLVINANYNNGTIEKTSGFTVTGVDTMVLGQHMATISFEGQTTTYSVSVTNQGASAGSASVASDLFISEYVEGSSGTNKAIEIFNGTGSSVDLSTYTLKLYTNGSTTAGSTLTLSGTLANNSVYVVAAATPTYSDILNNYDVYNAVVNFNGDDTITLWNGSTMIDIIGEIGKDGDNGTAFVGTPAGGDQTGTTVDRALRRASTIISPNVVFTWSEWNAYLDTASDLAKHDFASPDVTVLEQAVSYAQYFISSTAASCAAGNGSVSPWSTLSEEYGYMAAATKDEFYSNSTDTDIIAAKARYTLLVQKYSSLAADNFMKNSSGTAYVVLSANEGSILPTAEEQPLQIVLIVALLGVTALAGYFVTTRRKEDQA